MTTPSALELKKHIDQSSSILEWDGDAGLVGGLGLIRSDVRLTQFGLVCQLELSLVIDMGSSKRVFFLP